MRSAELGQGLVILRLRLLQRNRIVAGIEFHQRRSGLDGLIVVHMYGLDGAVDASSDWVQMAVDLGIIRILVTAGVEVPSNADGQQHKREYADDKWIDAAAGRSGLGGGVRLARCGSLCFRLYFSAHLLAPFECREDLFRLRPSRVRG